MAHTALFWEFFSIYEQEAVKVDFLTVLQMKDFHENFYCPCGFLTPTLLNINAHLKTHHKKVKEQIQKVKSMTSFEDFDNWTFTT